MDDNENTPLRDEIICSPDPEIMNITDFEWNSDNENSAAAPEAFLPQSVDVIRVKRSPTFDDLDSMLGKPCVYDTESENVCSE